MLTKLVIHATNQVTSHEGRRHVTDHAREGVQLSIMLTVQRGTSLRHVVTVRFVGADKMVVHH